MKYYIISADTLEKIVGKIKDIPEQRHSLSPMASDREVLAIEVLEGILKKESVDLSDAAIEENINNSLLKLPKGIHTVDFEIGYKTALKDVSGKSNI